MIRCDIGVMRCDMGVIRWGMTRGLGGRVARVGSGGKWCMQAGPGNQVGHDEGPGGQVSKGRVRG